MIRILCLIFLILFISCSGEKPEGHNKENPLLTERKVEDSYSLQIIPENPTRSAKLQLVIKGFEPSSAEITWLVNGRPVSVERPEEFDASQTKKGDSIQARALIKGKEILSNVVKIKNSPPEIVKIKIMPEVFKPGDTLYIEVTGRDDDGDNLSFLYEWLKNGEVVSTEKSLNVNIKRGDRIDVKVTPYDGEDYGNTVILHREIKNTPPIITSSRDCKISENYFLCKLHASDPDGDPLTYALKEAPPGMTIDNSGLIKWDIPPDFKGRARVTVSVTDGHGGEASQSFTLEITPQ